MKKISAIVPVYNSEKYLEKCLETIINQTYQYLEIILIDDGSNDSSGFICDKYSKKDNRIKVIHKENGGVSAARNIGINLATGEYIVFIDSDDWLDKDYIEQMIEMIEKYNVECAKFNLYLEDKKGYEKIKDNYKFPDLVLGCDMIQNWLLEMIVTNKIQAYLPTFIFSRNIIENIKFDEKVHMMEDKLFLINVLMRVNSIIISNNAYYHYRYNCLSASRSYENYLRNFNELFYINDCTNNLLEKNNISFTILEKNNANFLISIDNYYFYFYKMKMFNKKVPKVINYIDNIKNKTNIIFIPIKHKVSVLLIIYKQYFWLKKYYFLKSKIKKMLNRF